MKSQQDIDLDYLRGEAAQIHKNIQAAAKATEAAATVELLEKAISRAKQLRAKVKEATGARKAELKHHLQEAAAGLAAIVALHNRPELKHKSDEMLGAAQEAIEHITEAIALERRHATKSSTFN